MIPGERITEEQQRQWREEREASEREKCRKMTEKLAPLFNGRTVARFEVTETTVDPGYENIAEKAVLRFTDGSAVEFIGEGGYDWSGLFIGKWEPPTIEGTGNDVTTQRELNP